MFLEQDFRIWDDLNPSCGIAPQLLQKTPFGFLFIFDPYHCLLVDWEFGMLFWDLLTKLF